MERDAVVALTVRGGIRSVRASWIFTTRLTFTALRRVSSRDSPAVAFPRITQRSVSALCSATPWLALGQASSRLHRRGGGRIIAAGSLCRANAGEMAGRPTIRQADITMSTPSSSGRLLIIFVISVIVAPARGPGALSGQAPQSTQAPSTQAQQRPVFRGGTHFVRVDAYPVDNGKIVEGLTPEDFQVLEDDKTQAIDSFDFVSFETFTSEAARQEPRSQEEGFALAADPRNRVFVIVVDIPRSGKIDIHHIQQPL